MASTFHAPQRRRLGKSEFKTLAENHNEFFDDRLHVLAFPSKQKDHVAVFVGGRDGYGILYFMANLLLTRLPKVQKGLEIISCFGERLASFQGTCFELGFSNLLEMEDFLQLQQELTRQLSEFKLDEPLFPEHADRLEIEVPHDDKALLLDVATVFRELKVNLGFFRFDRFTDGTNQVVTKLSARCELPKGTRHAVLERRLKEVCPSDTAVFRLTPQNVSPAFLRKELARKRHARFTN